MVHRAEGDARARALHFDRMERRVPMGMGRDGVPVYLNADFLDGSRGAHVSISGISGVATKTSFATFLLYSVFRSGVLGGDAVNAKALIFNVKGEDLLFLDHPNTRLDEPTTAGVREARAVRRGLPGRAGLRPAAGRRLVRHARREQPADRRGQLLLDARPSSAPTGCCRTSSPTPTTSASSTRWWCTRSPPTWPGTPSPPTAG